jgi:hypothetical protein
MLRLPDTLEALATPADLATLRATLHAEPSRRARPMVLG